MTHTLPNGMTQGASAANFRPTEEISLCVSTSFRVRGRGLGLAIGQKDVSLSFSQDVSATKLGPTGCMMLFVFPGSFRVPGFCDQSAFAR